MEIIQGKCVVKPKPMWCRIVNCSDCPYYRKTDKKKGGEK